MSIAVLNSTYQHLPALRDSIAQLPDKRRPGWANTVAVALLLADRYQDKRGYVDETVGQVADALCLSESIVQTVLTALDQVGFWERTVKGNQYRGSRRVPAFMHRGADPMEQTGAEAPEHHGATPVCSDESDEGASWGSGPSIVGCTPEHRGADPATPPLPRIHPLHQHTRSTGDEGNLLEGDISELRVHKIGKLVSEHPDERTLIDVRYALLDHPEADDVTIALAVAR